MQVTGSFQNCQSSVSVRAATWRLFLAIFTEFYFELLTTTLLDFKKFAIWEIEKVDNGNKI